MLGDIDCKKVRGNNNMKFENAPQAHVVYN
jgi:hypothetical protein